MTSRLVLGCGEVGRDVVAGIDGRAGETTILVADERRAVSLREAGLPADRADPTEPARYPETADVVFVAGDAAERNVSAARRARERFPEATLVAYAGVDAARDAAVDDLRAVADRVVDPVAALSTAAVEATTDRTGRRSRGLRRLLGSLEGPLAVVAHDNPDPDAIAAAVGLADVAESAGVSATPCYCGEISHRENRALVNLLDVSLTRLSDAEVDDWLADYDGVALVDHTRPGVNDSLPEATAVDAVVDHHPPRAPVDATFVDLAPDVGAASTLVAEYYRRLGLDLSRTVASALLYGLRVDTADFTRGVDERDYDAAAFLFDRADTDVLDRIERPSVGAETFAVLARAIHSRDRRGSAVVSFVGGLSDRDALSQAAERLLTIDDVRTTVVAGVLDDTVYVSGRARGADVDLGEALREAFGPIGSAGGHTNMAGAQLPLGILAEVGPESRSTLRDAVEPVVAERVFETLTDAPAVPATDAAVTEYADGGGSTTDAGSVDADGPAGAAGTDGSERGSDAGDGPDDDALTASNDA